MFLFVGSFMIDKLGQSAAFTISSILLGLDGIICFFAPNYTVLMVARVISGIGLGMNMGAMNALIAERFNAQMQNVMNTVKVGDPVRIGGIPAVLTQRIWYDPENRRPLGK